MPSGRKKPFSGKQKKLQLQAKKTAQSHNRNSDDEEDSVRFVAKKGIAARAEGSETNAFGTKFFDRQRAPTRADPGRYALIFRPESREEVERMKKDARKTIHPVLEEYLECTSEDFYTPELDFPIRPTWNYALNREELERNESRYFQEYLKEIDRRFERSDLSYFELNLETWRQFWRVLEMSDILLCVVDIRYPPLLFPPKLYEYVCKDLGKQVIVVLNKIDICPAPLVLAWKDYFSTKYKDLEVHCFTSYPAYNLHGNLASTAGLQKNKKVRGHLKMAAEGAMELYKVCDKLVQGRVDLSKWKQKILEEMNATGDEDESVEIEKVESLLKQDTGYQEFKPFREGILTIGCLGQPNVGKSSLINALMGKKVVSVSRTPGHTKHFQTIFLTPNVRLCDCPGLIFPSKVPKPLQVLCGSYPIAQLRDPFSTIKYLGQRLDLPKIMGITHPEGDTEWSAFDIADGWALKRGYYTAKASRLDSYRGANHILRMTLEGRICLCLRPPNYTTQKDKYSTDPRVAEIMTIQAKSGVSLNPSSSVNAEAVSSSEESEESGSEDESGDNDRNLDSQPGPRNDTGGDDADSSEGNESNRSPKKKPVCSKKAKTKKKPTLHNKFSMLGELDGSESDTNVNN